ncbi:MAG: hypothetical protein DMG65_02310 [Candidatus Angelobacter sp. Gp1-AA117]|nr:MAG: hypothetical protein DMG65_02310 [Candidatus Angelobacter sp. Gp1-AA117]
MTPERWARIKDVFAAVVDQPAEARTPALIGMCQGDQDLQAHVEELLSQHDEMGKFLDGTPPSKVGGNERVLQPGEALAGRYRITAHLGSGGMGEVYEAEDLELNEQIALKVIRQHTSIGSAIVDRLRREVQLARKVTHPNVCRVFDLGYHRQDHVEIIFLTMELIRGETLSERLKRLGKLEPQEAFPIAVQLCQALNAAHQAGVLHRDFKCGNVMLIGSGEQVRAVVTDFGIARGMSSAQDHTGTVTAGMIVGTPSYMSPEQIMGKPLTAASDIYSLGLVLYEMVTGKRPFHEQSSWTEALKRLTENAPAPVQSVPQVGANWNATILKCLERDPAKRFSSAQQVIESLRYGPRPRSWSRTAMAALACALLLVSAATYFFFNRWGAVPLPQERHIAVLPFSFSGSDASDRAIANELAESLNGYLARLQASENSLWVVPWSEVKNRKPQDTAGARTALGVNLLITGSLEHKNDKYYLHIQLKDAQNSRDLRSQVVEAPQSQAVTLEDTLIERTSAMLQIHVPSELQHHIAEDETTVPGAFEFYEQGKGYLARYEGLEDVDRAISLLQTAIDKDSHFALAYANLAFAYAAKYRLTADLKWLDKAKPICEQAISLNDKLAPAHVTLGMIREGTGNLDGAIREYEQALELDPTDDYTRNLLSLAYDKAGRLLQAEALLKSAVKRNPASWVNYNFLGYFYYRHAQYSQAEPQFLAASQLAPDNPRTFSMLGGVYLAECKYKEAEDILARQVALQPTYAAYSNLGTARLHQARYSDAAQMFQKATGLRPDDDRLWYNLGNAYSMAGEQAKATAAYQKALELGERVLAVRPKDDQLQGRLILYYAKLGQKEKTQRTLAQLARRPVNEPEIWFNAAVAYELLGERAHGLDALHSAAEAGYSLCEIQSAPELASLRNDKRYIAALGTANK